MPVDFRPTCCLGLLVVAALTSLPVQAQMQPQNRPLSAAAAPSFASGPSTPIQGRYIVTFKNEASTQVSRGPSGTVAVSSASSGTQLMGAAQQIHHVYNHAIKGFAATMADHALEAMRRNPMVESVVQDHTMHVSQTSPQTNAPWGLDRIDQRGFPLNQGYSFNATGQGVYAFIIDTGIRSDHSEFAGRVMAGATAIQDGLGSGDCHGHGTHVAGTVGGTTWGVAKRVTLVPVRVFGCNGGGYTSDVIAGIEWAVVSALRPAVINLSLVGLRSGLVNQAVANAVSRGVTVVASAGNEGKDACLYSPASAPTAITVGASTWAQDLLGVRVADYFAPYSNHGSCVDLIAPGTAITSANYEDPNGSLVLNGTSMAAAHVSGMVALLLQANPEASPAQVTQFIKDSATPNMISELPANTPNLMLYSLPAVGTLTKTLSVLSLSGSASAIPNGWNASVKVTVREAGTTVTVPNATVTATYSPGGAAVCTTNAQGSCELRSTNFSRALAATRLTVNKIIAINQRYDSTNNHVTTLSVNRP